MRWGNREQEARQREYGGGYKEWRAESGGRADWLRQRPPREAERGGTTSGLDGGGQSLSFEGARREWTHSGIVEERGEQ